MKSILIATADAEKMNSLTDLLQKRGYFVIPAGDEDLALSFLEYSMHIDAVVADYQLPDFSRLMRAARWRAPVSPRVIAMSGRISVNDYLDALSSGAFEFFFWPIRSCEFLKIVQAALPQEEDRLVVSEHRSHGAAAGRPRGGNDYFL
jgi:DNA-binding response OmpR family regulator